MVRVDEFDYDLPVELIAQTPLEKRDSSRLLLVDRGKNCFYHRLFPDLIESLRPGDLLVFNDTRVIPARLWGRRIPGAGKVEVLLLTQKDEERWEALVRPGRKLLPGQRISFGDSLFAVVETRTSFGGRVLRFERSGEELRELINSLGEAPLPPYIKAPLQNRERYQTVYAKHEGSAAAPTAGLHFTPELMAKIKRHGVEIGYLTLHVGLGTFRPVKTAEVADHRMHAEFYQIPPLLVAQIDRARTVGGRVIAVGTTTVRALESAADEEGKVISEEGWTEIFIYPGYRFKVIDGLLTNFHLPRSTLLMLVSAFTGRELLRLSYEEAVRQGYRFFSFGDAMLII